MMIRNFLNTIQDFARFFIIYMPGGLGIIIRRAYYKLKFKKCGNNLVISEGVIIEKPEYMSIGDNVFIDKYCIIVTDKVDLSHRILKRKINEAFCHKEGELIIGRDVHIAQFSIIMAHGGVNIEDKCTLSSGTKIYSLTSIPNDPNISSRIISIMPYEEESPSLIAPVALNENTWVGLNCIIMPGVSIGKNSFVRSNSLLLGEFSENSYIAGDPARKIRNRFEDREMTK